MRTVEITINGVKMQVSAGKTVLEVARETGIDIPAFCSDPRLKPFGACRMCLVEIEGARGPVTACTTLVREGMVVRTETDEVVSLRQTALRFLLREHYGDCYGPCHTACPAGIDIQGFIALIAAGKNAEALSLIKQALPFPAVCGRVCPRFCEVDCRRNIVDKPVAICHLKRYVADIDLALPEPYMPERKPATGKSVGVVGGGPAGLTAAYYLAILGHAVTVYEGAPELGGMLRYAIPEYRLPRDVLANEISTITRLCEDVKVNTKLGKDISVESLSEKHDAVVLAMGAIAPQNVPCDGQDKTGNFAGIDFLWRVAAGEKINIGDKVAVVGGGNTAMDCARTARRMGASQVTVFYRRSRNEMPANHEEVEQAEEEGIVFRFLANPVGVAGDECVDGITCCEMELGAPDASGRRRPQPVPGSDFTTPVDSIIWATGQVLDPTGVTQLNMNRWGYINTDKLFQTSIPRVFAAGDCITGPTTVVEASASGHKLAGVVHQFLTGEPLALPAEEYKHTKGKNKEVDPADYVSREKIERVEPALRPADVRKSDFLEFDPGFAAGEALAETARCMSCGCEDVHDCLLKKYSTRYSVKKPKALRKRAFPVFTDHPFITRDPNKCILCGNCVRICSEVQAATALGFTSRGFETSIKPTLGRPLAETTCESCSQCISACPTGAITAVVALPKPGPWVLDKTQSACAECSVGCDLCLETTASMVVRVTSPVGSPVNDGNLCKKGAFVTHKFRDAARVTAPMVADASGKLVPATWDEALRAAAAGLLAGGAGGAAGAGTIAGVVSSRTTTEEAYLVSRLTGGRSVGLPGDLAQKLGYVMGSGLAATYADLESSDALLVVDADLPEDFPVAAIKVRQAVEKGAKLLVLGTKQTRLGRSATSSVLVSKSELARVLSASSGEVADFVAGAASPVVLVDLDAISLLDLKALGGACAARGRGWIIGFTQYGNAMGLWEAGALGGAAGTGEAGAAGEAGVAGAAGAVSAAGSSSVATTLAAIAGSLESASLRGIALASGGCSCSCSDCGSAKPFVVCITPALTDDVARLASVVIPGSTLPETSGSYTNSEGRVRSIARAIKPVSGKQTYEVLLDLAAALGRPMNFTDPTEISTALRSERQVAAAEDRGAGSAE